MGIQKYTKKIDDYFERLNSGKAKEIKPDHVGKIIVKLKAKEANLSEEISQTAKDTKKERLARKRLIVREQITRAEGLLKKFTP